MTAERYDISTAPPADAADEAAAGRGNADGLRADRGSATVFIVIFTIAAFMLVSLLVDGGAAIEAKERAADIAGQAARAVANDISVASLRSGNGQPTIAGDACAKAAALVSAYQVSSDMQVAMGPCSGAGGTQASVTVSVTTTPLIPGFLGSFTQTDTATAIPECGITQGQRC